MDIYNHKKRKYTDTIKKEKRKINEVYNDQFNLYNAKINVVKPILDDQGVSNISDTGLPTESKVKTFYDEFKNNNISVVGNYSILKGGTKQQEQKIDSLENEILQKLFKDTESNDFEDVDVSKPNVDIPGADETDFDTIYELYGDSTWIVKA